MTRRQTESVAIPSHPDLDAVVHLGPVADELLDELPDLYCSLLSTRAWFGAFDQKTPTGVCLLAHPRHVIVFFADGDTVEIMNKAFAIAPEDVRRAGLAIFAAVPGTRRIHLEVLFDPRELQMPKRVLHEADHLVIDLPRTVQAYDDGLDDRMRRNLRTLEDRLRREHPDVSTQTMRPNIAGLRDLTTQFVDWNTARLRARGSIPGSQTDQERRSKLFELVLQGGAQSLTTTIGDRVAAVQFIFYVGDEATVFAGSFDEQHDDVHLGLLSTYWAVLETLRHGAKRCHLLWTSDSYSGRLGAHPVTATRLSVFPSNASRLWSLDEVREIVQRNVGQWGRMSYRRARRAVSERAERHGLDIGRQDR